ncbi:hypothetical protein N9V57_04020 [SAR86 cluster bacterium]|nr:hypothetical protein [SAR86 cluster bacterium]
MSLKKIAIVGHGFVGKATEFGFSKNSKLFIVDPKVNTSISDIKDFSPDFIFVCVPTPMNKSGSQDFSIVQDVFKQIKSSKVGSCVILKSTVTPENIVKAKNIIPNFIYNPEFLRESNAREDFINSKMIIIAGEEGNQQLVKNLYLENSLCETKNFIFTDIETASLIKYTVNSFLALKVLFFNQVKDIFETNNSQESWENFIKYLSYDDRIGNSHMQVPGPDGKKGFGGACFTKDTAALLDFSSKVGKEISLLKKAIQINNEIRSNYKNLDQREKDQNVNYEFDK